MFTQRKFRINPFLLGVPLTVLALLGIQVSAMMHRRPSPLLSPGLPELFLLGGMWIIAIVVFTGFPEYVGTEGVRGTDGMGRWHDVRWAEMRSVRSFLGFLWIRRDEGRTVLCLPRFLRDWSEFRAYVLAHAPEDNPLRTALRRG